MSKKQTIGERIKKIRGSLTQTEFGKMLGVGRTTVIRYEKNERSPDADFIIRMNVLFKVQPYWLLTGKGEVSGGVKLTPREASVIEQYRVADEQGRYAVDATLKAVIKKQPRG